MLPTEIKKGIFWVGAIDWDLRNFHGYLTQKGSTYNAYLIIDEKITLIDTVKSHFSDEMMERIRAVVDPAKIDYVVSNHVEMDHSGALPHIMSLCKNATLVTSPNGKKGLEKHFSQKWNYKVVETGDSISIGNRTLKFVLMQMVHWPDSMAVYIPEEKLLLPNDAFGQHIASSERFDDEIGFDIAHEEAARYYANIVLPYGKQVKQVLSDISTLEIDMIAPSHGVIWRRYIKKIIDLYKSWSNNDTENRAIIVYDTMWGSTAMIATALSRAFEENGYAVRMMNLQTNHISDVLMHLLTAKYICVGSPTLNNNMLPTISAFLTYLKGLAPKSRTAMAFGSYGWGGQSIGQVHEILAGCGFDMLDSIKVQYIPTAEKLDEIKNQMKGAISCQR
jgi:flavorubredoxin